MKKPNGRASTRKALYSTLSNQTRIDILMFLMEGERNVTQIVRKLSLGQPLVSYNLRKLAEAGFLRVRKAGNFRYYAADKEFAAPFLAAVDTKRGSVPGPTGTRTPGAIFVLDRNGAFAFVGGDLQTRFGMPKTELVGKSVFKVFKGRKEIVENIRRALDGNSMTWTVRMKGRTHEIATVAFKDDAGRPGEVIAAVYDVTRREKAESRLRVSEGRMEALMERSGDFLAHIDRDGIFLEVDEATMGDMREKLVGTPLYDYLTEASKTTFKNKLKAVFKDGKNRRFLAESVCGEIRAWYECRLLPLKIGGKIVAATVASSAVRDSSG